MVNVQRIEILRIQLSTILGMSSRIYTEHLLVVTTTITRVATIWPFSSNLKDPTWNWRIYLLWARKSTKKSYLTTGNPSTMATCCGPPANLRIFWSVSKYVILYTNRCEISCWFQKCITLYVYFAYFMSYFKKKAILGIGAPKGIHTIFTVKILKKEPFARWTCFISYKRKSLRICKK